MEEKSLQTDSLYKIRHSVAHVLAQAVLEVRPEAKLGFGPPIETGCYYDFEFDTPITEEDFDSIEERMRSIIKEGQEFKATKIRAEEALDLLRDKGESFKLEYCQVLIEQGEVEIGFYQNGSFQDMCAGPHVPNTLNIPRDCFKIDSLAGAYWRGDEKNVQLTRIYCLVFENKKNLKNFVRKRELAKERDHRKLGTELDLFSIDHEGVGAGLILWHPKGALVRHLMEEYSKKLHLNSGYDFVFSPHIGRASLWETSGHLSFYKDGMFAPIEVEGQEFYLKPMNCPFHCKIFASRKRSYRELPLRFAEWGTVYRFERSGTLSGLTRVRGFTQDDAHLFCREDQMPEEIDRVLQFCTKILADFGMAEFHLYLSTRPEKRVGEESKWDAAEIALKSALERSAFKYTVNEGDGAFYGPKIDICAKDALDREWQLSTIQFDFNLPDRFNLQYIDMDGESKRPYMIHRALMGSIERFFGVILEHFGGAFPTWLAPVQIRIIPVAETFFDYASELKDALLDAGIRVEVDDSTNSLGKKIREATVLKIPNLAIVGDKERTTGTATLRRYKEKEQRALSVEELLKFLNDLNVKS